MYADNLFDDDELSKKTNFEDNSGKRGQDGLYRIDLEKVKPENKKRGYRAVLRFVPNFTEDPEYIKAYMVDKYNEDTKVALGPSFYNKVSHYLKLNDESVKHLSGYYDAPTNVNPNTQKPYSSEKWGPLAKTYFNLDKSKNAMLKERAKMIKYNNKFFSYVLVIEDEQQPELEGKVMIFEYGRQIQEIIEMVQRGDLTGMEEKPFSLKIGLDFTLIAKENSFKNNEGEEVKAPTYIHSSFDKERKPISLPKKQEDGSIKWVQVPLNEDGNISSAHKEKIVNFLLKREHHLEDFAGKAWTEEQQAKVNNAIAYLTGKQVVNSTSESTTNESSDTSEPEDFSFDDASTGDFESDEDSSTEKVTDDEFDDMKF